MKGKNREGQTQKTGPRLNVLLPSPETQNVWNKHADWLTLWSRVLLENLAVAYLVWQYPASRGTRRFTGVVTRVLNQSPHETTWIQPTFLHTFTFNIYFNVLPPSTPTSSELSLPLRLSNPKLCIHFSCPSWDKVRDMLKFWHWFENAIV
jgi:hypothetical protein